MVRLSEEKRVLYDKVLDKFGLDNQLCQLMEECGGLIQATNHFKRSKNNLVGDKFFEEIADVEIMIEQFKHLYGDDQIKKFKSEKLVRLSDLVNVYEGSSKSLRLQPKLVQDDKTEDWYVIGVKHKQQYKAEELLKRCRLQFGDKCLLQPSWYFPIGKKGQYKFIRVPIEDKQYYECFFVLSRKQAELQALAKVTE